MRRKAERDDPNVPNRWKTDLHIEFERKMIFNQKIADNIKYRFSNMNVMNVKEKEKIIVALLQTT